MSAIVLLDHLAFAVVLRDGRFGDEAADLHLQISMARMHRLELLGRRFLREHRRHIQLADGALDEIEAPAGQHRRDVSARPAVPVNSAVASPTSMAVISNRMSCVLVWGCGAPSFHTADVAAGKLHLSALIWVSGFGGSAACLRPAPRKRHPAMSRKANVSLIICVRMKRLAIVLSLLAATVALTAGAQNQTDARLKRLFPAATTFSPKGGDPPHVKAYNGDDACLATRSGPRRFCRSSAATAGRSRCCIGIDTKGLLTGLIIIEHHEPYGDFSIEPPAFAAQFKGKDVRDPFKLGEDIDAVSRATITMSSAVRTIRNSCPAHGPRRY